MIKQSAAMSQRKAAEFGVKNQPLSAGAIAIIQTAERLFAENGLEAVSTRMISREAGHKNHSALQYHFGSKDGLLEAILDYRVTPINKLRLQSLEQVRGNGRVPQLRDLVAVFVEPFARQLLKPPEETYYVSILAQLYAYQKGRDLFTSNRVRTRALHEITSMLIKAMKPLPIRVIHLRLQLMGRQTMTAIAEWDEARRIEAIELDIEALQWRTSNLIDFIVGGLLAPEYTKSTSTSR